MTYEEGRPEHIWLMVRADPDGPWHLHAREDHHGRVTTACGRGIGPPMKPSKRTYRQMALPDASDIRTAEGVAYDPSVYATPVGECEVMDEWRETVAKDNDAREVLCPQCSRLHGHWSGGALYLWDHDEGGHVRVDCGPGAYVDARCKCGCEWRIAR